MKGCINKAEESLLKKSRFLELCSLEVTHIMCNNTQKMLSPKYIFGSNSSNEKVSILEVTYF